MKSYLFGVCTKLTGMFAALAMLITMVTVNSTCIYLTHQDKLPETAKKLRKF